MTHAGLVITVRRAGPDDWSVLRDLRLQALGQEPLAFGSTLAREQAFTEAVWRERAGSNATFLAHQGRRLVGTATGYVEPAGPAGLVQLVAMYVDPMARGTGCAHRLIDAVAGAAAAGGARRLLLQVTDVNPVAQRCYRRYGFVETGRTMPLPHAPDVLEVEMALDLGSGPDHGPSRG